MVSTNLPDVQELDFRHFVVSKESGILYASARENGGRIRNFLIDDANVRVQHGSEFTAVSEQVASAIRSQVSLFFHKVPVYTVSDLPQL